MEKKLAKKLTIPVFNLVIKLPIQISNTTTRFRNRSSYTDSRSRCALSTNFITGRLISSVFFMYFRSSVLVCTKQLNKILSAPGRPRAIVRCGLFLRDVETWTITSKNRERTSTIVLTSRALTEIHANISDSMTLLLLLVYTLEV